MLIRLIKAIDRMLLAQPENLYEQDASSGERSIDVMQLEERVMYSAVPFIDPAQLSDGIELAESGEQTDIALVDPVSETQQDSTTATESPEQLSDHDLLASPLEAARTLELVFVDSSIENVDQVIDDLIANRDPSRYLEIVYLDPTDDLGQVYSQLPTGAAYDAIHFFTHGTTGGIQIGNTLLTNENIAAWAGQISSWGNFLRDGGDILLYGCDLASDDGKLLVDSIAALTGADVASSDDITGHEDLGGDWDFEYLVGAIETNVAVSAELQNTWYGTLDITSNLVGHYDFEEGGGGTLTDSTGNQNGTLVNTASWSTDEAVGNYALDFSGDAGGSNAHVTVTDNAAQDFGSGDWTVAFWYNLNGTPSEASRLVGDFDGSGESTGFLIYADTVGDINLVLEDSVATSSTDWQAGTFDGTWQHVALAFDSSANTVRWYFNGSQVHTSSFSGGSINTSDVLRIGGSSTSSGDYEGMLDDVRLYTRELNSTDISELYSYSGSTSVVWPSATDDAFSTTPAGSAHNVLTNDIPSDGGTVSVIDFTDVSNGSLVDNGSGSFTYTPNGGFTGTDSFDYLVNDDQTGLSHYYGLAGNGLDSVGSNDSSSITGTTTVSGSFGDAMWFDEVDDHVVIPDFAYQSEFSLSFDFKLDDNTGSTFQYLYSHGTVSNTNSLNIYVAESSLATYGNQLFTNFQDGNDSAYAQELNFDISGITGDGQWHTYTMTVDATNGTRVYLDGVLQASDATRGGDSFNPTTDIYLGGREDLNSERFFGGGLDSFRIFNRSLDTQEVSALADVDSQSATASLDVAVEEGTFATAASDGGLNLNNDGGNDIYLEADSSPFTGNDQITIEVEFSIDSPATGMTTLFSYTDPTDQDELFVGIDTDGEVYFRTSENGGTGYGSITNAAQLFDGEKHTVSVTWENSGGILMFYVDGEQLGLGRNSYQDGTTIGAGGTIVFGQHSTSPAASFDSDDTFSGTIYGARVFSDVRTTEEISANYQTELPHDEAGMIAQWRFDELSTYGVVTDSVSGNNLTLKHTSESGFTASVASLALAIDENAIDGTVVGSVSGVDAEREAVIASLIAADPDLVYSAETGKFYKAVWGTTNWADASSGALSTQLNSVDGQLANIRSATEQEIAATFSASGDLWIGATDATVEGEHRWTQDGSDADQFWAGDGAGSSVDGAYSNWLSGRPDNSNGNQHFTFIRSDGFWNEEDATHTENGYLVEWDADEVLDANQALTYSIESQTVAGAFEVDADSGQIRVLDGTLLDADTQATHTVTIRVTDVDLNTFDKTFTISLNDLVEDNNAPIDLSSGIELNTDGGNNAYLVTTNAQSILGGRSELTFESMFSLEGTGSQQVLISYNTAAVDNAFLVTLESDGTIDVLINGDAETFSTEDYQSLLADGEIHHLAITWQNSSDTISLYIDGDYVESVVSTATGAILSSDASSAIVFAQEQDSVDGGYDSTQLFSGTLYDVRIWDEIRSEANIALNYQHKFDSGSLPSGLIANWQMDGFNGSSEVVDVVSGNNLSIGQVPNSAPAVAIQSWSNELGGVTASGSTITYVDESGSSWGTASINSAAFSSYGYTDDYTLAFQIDNKTDYNFMIGLGETESGIHYNDIEHAMFFDELGNNVEVFQNGVSQGQFTLNYLAGDEFSFYVNGTTIEYQHNGNTFYTATGVTAATDWYVDSDFNPGGGQDDFSLSGFRLFSGNVEASGSIGFTTSTPTPDLHISEVAGDGTTVGHVIPNDADAPEDIVADGQFLEAGIPASPTTYSATQTFGGWTVDAGNIQVLGDWFGDSPLGGNSIDLNGSTPGTISQTLTTEVGKTYQVSFAITGMWAFDSENKDVRVGAGGISEDFTVEYDAAWNKDTSPLWQYRTFEFVATSTSTKLSFQSLETGTAGVALSDIQVIDIPQSISAILNADSTLSYDAGTGKFYRLVTSAATGDDAVTQATSASLNGVTGQLVTIGSEYENRLVQDFAKTAGENVWIGASDSAVEGEWRWLDGSSPNEQFWSGAAAGSAVGGNYTNWLATEPNDSGGIQDGAKLRAADGLWTDIDSTSNAAAYVIEWDASEVISNYTFSLTGDAGGRFSIDSNSGEITVANSSLIDYETNTSHSVTVEVTDAAGNTYSEAMTIEVDNIGPTQTIPIAQVINEGATLVFNTANGNAISVSDDTDADARIQVTLSVTNGTLQTTNFGGYTFVSGFNGSSTFTLEGTEADINAALQDLQYTPNQDYTGSDTLTITTAFNADLEGLYTFEGGNADDQSASTPQNGTFVGDATTVIDGTRGEVLSLDGTGDYVQISDTFGNPTSVSIGGWVNFSGAGRQEFISVDDHIHIALDDGGNGVKGSIQTGASTWNDLNSNISLSGTGWHHVMYTFDDVNNVHNLYIDGQLVATESITDSVYWTGAANTYIGQHPTNAWNLNGLVDDARIYARALSANEVAAIAGDESEISDNVAITVNPINDAPNITALESDYQQAVNDGTTVNLDAAGLTTISDIDSNDFDGGSIQIVGNSFDAADQIGIDTSGSISLSAGMANGSVVSVSGVAIGTLASVTNDGFTLSLNSDSTIARTETVLQEITFSSTSTVFGSRTVDVTLVDGDGTANGGSDSTTVSTTVNLASSLNGSVTTNEDTTYTYLATDFDFTGIVGTDLRAITIQSLPTDGQLQLNSVTVTVGQTITKAQIDAGQLTYTANQNANGAPQTTFSFSVNSGNQSINILTGEPSGYSLNSSYLTSTDEILLNESNFGISGTNATHLQFESTSTTIDAAYLSQGEVYFGGYVSDGNLDAGELAALDSWVNSGGVLISTSDSASYDSIPEHFGLVIGGSASSTWHVADTANAIINGDFGSVGNVGDPISASGTISYFNSASLAVGDVVVATDSGSGEPTIVLRQHGDGWIVFTSDEGIFRAGMTGGGAVTTPNDILAANLFAWAAEVATPELQTMEVNVVAVNDGPTLNSLDGTPTYIEGGTAVILDASVAVSDPELDALNGGNGNYSDASLTLGRNGGVSSEDVFSFNDGNGITLSGGNLIKNSQVIASFDVLTTSGELLLTFTDANGEIPTTSDVDNILSQITYANSSDTPPTSVQIDWTFDDGNTGSQGSGGALQDVGSTTVNITAVNDTPSVTGPGTAYSTTEQTDLNIHGTGFSVTDVDAASGTMTATLAAGEGTITLAAGDSGVSVTANNASTVTFTGTLSQINNLLTGGGTGTIVYNNGSDAPSASTTITLTVNDGGNTGTDPGLTADGSSEEDSAVQTINITATNDDPTNAGSLPADVTVTEDVISTVDLSSIDFSDLDAGSSDLTVTLSTSTGGQLTLASDVNIDFSGTATARTLTGTLTELNNYFNGTANINYLHGTPHTYGNDADTITVVINDNGNTGTGGGTNQTLGVVNVDITAVNDAPVVSAIEGTPLSYTENDGAVTVTSTITFTDLDDTNIESAQVQISSGYNSSEDVLLFVNQNGISGSFNPVSGIWSLTGSATLGDYETAIRSITYENVSDNPDTTTRTISFTINDGDANSNTLTRDINITATNDLPTISNLAADTLAYTEGDGAQIIDQGVAAAASDVDSADFDGGALSVSFTAGSDSAEDVLGIDNQGTGAGQIGVSGSNVTYGGVTIGTFTGGSSGVTLTINLNASADDVAATALLQAITYENTDTDSPTTTNRTVRFVLSDGDGGTSADYDATITVSRVNDAATITGLTGDQLNYAEGDGVQRIEQLDDVSVSDIDSADFDTGSLTVSIVSGGDSAEDVVSIINQGTGPGQIGVSGSTVTLSGTTIGTFTGGSSGTDLVITLNANADPAAATALIKAISYENTDTDNPTTGNRTVRFTLNDGDGATSLNHDAIVAVSGVNDDPINAGSLPTDITVTEDVLSNVDLSSIVLNDVDHSGGNLTITLTTGGGNLTASSGGGVSVGGTSTAMTLTGTQSSLNTFLSNPANVRYLHPTANTYGDNADTLAVQVTDNGNTGSGGGGNISLGVVNIDISGVNDDPTNSGTLPTDITVNEDILSAVDLSSINLSDLDDNGGNLTLKLNSTTGGQFYATSGAGVTVIGSGSTSLWLNGDLAALNAFIDIPGNINYQHSVLNTAGNDADTFLVSVTDNGNSGSGGGGDIVLGNVNVDITEINDAPIVTGERFGTNEDTSLAGDILANDLDPESDPMTAILVSGPSSGGITLNADGTFTYAPSLNFNGTDTFVYRVTDGSATSSDATATISVAPVNDRPIAIADTYDGIAGDSISISNVLGLLNNDIDVDGDALSVVFIGGTFDGILSLNPDGSFTYTPPAASLNTVVFTYAVTDGSLQSDPMTVSLSFAAAPPPPDPTPEPEPVDPEPEEEVDDEEDVEELLRESGTPITTIDSLEEPSDGVSTVAQNRQTVDAINLQQVEDNFQLRLRQVDVRDLNTIRLPDLAESRFSRLVSRVDTLNTLNINYDVQQLQIVLDDFHDEVIQNEEAVRMVSGTVNTIVIGATAGTAIFMTTSSYLVAMLSSSMPAWAGFDPVYVVQSRFRKTDADNQSLADLIRQGAEELGGTI